MISGSLYSSHKVVLLSLSLSIYFHPSISLPNSHFSHPISRSLHYKRNKLPISKNSMHVLSNGETPHQSKGVEADSKFEMEMVVLARLLFFLGWNGMRWVGEARAGNRILLWISLIPVSRSHLNSEHHFGDITCSSIHVFLRRRKGRDAKYSDDEKTVSFCSR